jgi:hypothetical protein
MVKATTIKVAVFLYVAFTSAYRTRLVTSLIDKGQLSLASAFEFGCLPALIACILATLDAAYTLRGFGG